MAATRYENVVKLQGDPGKDYGPAGVSTTRNDLMMQPDDTLERRPCAYCGGSLPLRSQRRQKYCGQACRNGMTVSPSTLAFLSADGIAVTTGTRGAISELRAVVDLMERGFHVYRAMSPSCPCDLVIWKGDGRAIRVEVKTAKRHQGTGMVYRQDASKNVFDVLCHVVGDEVLYDPPVEEWDR